MGLKSFFFGKTKSNATGIQETELADARRGIIFFLSQLEVQPDSFKASDVFCSSLGEGVGLNVLSAAEDVFTGKIERVDRCVNSVKGKVDNAKGWVDSKVQSTIDRTVGSYMTNMSNSMTERYGPIAGEVICSGTIITLKNTIITTLTNSIPVWGMVNDGSAAVSGVIKAGNNAYRLGRQAYMGYGVELLNGHPTVITNALARHTTSDCFAGIRDASINSAKLAAAIATGGISKLADVLIDILLAIWRFFDRIIQITQLTKHIDTAKKAWQLKDSGSSFMNHHDLFSAWYRDVCIVTPIFGALSIVSGYAGNPMRFLNLVQNGEIIASNSFNKGVKYIDEVKAQSTTWIKNYADDYCLKFVSPDPVVNHMLLRCGNGEKIPNISAPTLISSTNNQGTISLSEARTRGFS